MRTADYAWNVSFTANNAIKLNYYATCFLLFSNTTGRFFLSKTKSFESLDYNICCHPRIWNYFITQMPVSIKIFYMLKSNPPPDTNLQYQNDYSSNPMPSEHKISPVTLTLFPTRKKAAVDYLMEEIIKWINFRWTWNELDKCISTRQITLVSGSSRKIHALYFQAGFQ